MSIRAPFRWFCLVFARSRVRSGLESGLAGV